MAAERVISAAPAASTPAQSEAFVRSWQCLAKVPPRPRGSRLLMVALLCLTLDKTEAWAQMGSTPVGTVKDEKQNGIAIGGQLGGLGGGTFGGVQFTHRGGGGFGGFGAFGGVVRLEIKVEPNMPLQGLLPLPPPWVPSRPPWLVKDLAEVPEVFFQRPLELPIQTAKEHKGNVKGAAVAQEPNDALQQSKNHIAMQLARGHIAQTLAKINHLNQQEADRFVKALMESRPDLAGLPFVMGDACRMTKCTSRQFVFEVGQLRATLGGNVFGQLGGNQLGQIGGFGTGFAGGGFQGIASASAIATEPGPSDNEIIQARVAAWMQMLATEPAAKRLELVKKLADVPHTETTRALGRLAVFSLEKEIRDAAIAALKDRAGHDYAPPLLQGLRYPWPEFARYATDAIVSLDRQDLVPSLVDFLDEPDPRAPAERDLGGQQVPVVRELVRLNHHHNCITCHAPATSDPDFKKHGATSDFVTGQVTIPGQNLAAPTPGFGYTGGGTSFPDLAVRVDVTYLRQDFSLLQKVNGGMTGAEAERFDFLVRARAMNAQEVAAYRAWREKQRPKYVSPNHQFALAALRRLTGLDAEATAAAWREALRAE
jgi:hypothetical protein